MAAEYDQLAQKYKQSKELPFRAHVEAYTFFKMLGDLQGLSVLDLACGEGHYTRLIRRRGAARVVGADLSGEMIALAKSQEEREPLGIEYVHSSAEDLGSLGTFDLVVAAFLLNYATSPENLEAMCRTIAANLKPGGRFVTINCNLGPGIPPDISPYGWTPTDLTPIEEGVPYHLTFLQGPQSFTIQNVYYSPETHEAAFRASGFTSVRWHPPEVSDEGVAQFGRDFWQFFINAQPIIGIECQK